MKCEKIILFFFHLKCGQLEVEGDDGRQHPKSFLGLVYKLRR